MKKMGLIGLIGLMSLLRVTATPQTSDADLKAAQSPVMTMSGLNSIDCGGGNFVLSGDFQSVGPVTITNARNIDCAGLTTISQLTGPGWNLSCSSEQVSGFPNLLSVLEAAFFSAVAPGNSTSFAGCSIRDSLIIAGYSTSLSVLDLSSNQIPGIDFSTGASVISDSTTFNFSNNPMLTTIAGGDGTSTGFTWFHNGTMNLGGCALTNASEDSLLGGFVALETNVPGNNGVIDISGGTNAVPDGAGASDVSALVGAGWTITTN